MKNKWLPVLILCILSAKMVEAQQDGIVSQYHLNPAMINPSYSGLYNSLMINANARMQWVGIEGSPFSNYLTVTSSFVDSKVGGGILVTQDNLGVTSSTEMGVMGAYAFEVEKNTTFSFGLQGGFVSLRQDNDELNLRTFDDPDFPPGIANITKPNFGAGISLMGERYYIGFSVPRLLNVRFDEVTGNGVLYRRHYYTSASFLLDATAMMKLKPVALIRYVEGAPLSFDIGANILWNHKFWFGAYTRNFSTQGALIQFIVHQTIRLGYAVEVPTTRNIETKFVSHEFVVGIDLRLLHHQEPVLRYF